eukprot:Em0001g1711a
MGVVKQKYISSVYLNQLYQQVVAGVAEESMKAAVEHVKESPHHATSGEGDHQSCSSESPCQQPGYVPKRKPLTMPAAISAYEAALRKTLIYKNADSCHLCRDTYWVESFNHQLLTYLPKRIHFHTKTFEMRMSLAVMDWNENCQRMATSHHEYTDVRRPDHHSTYNVLVKKTYRFVNNIWSMYVLRNITSQQILQDDEDDDDMVLPDDAAMYDGDYVDSEDDDYVCSEDGGDDEDN